MKKRISLIGLISLIGILGYAIGFVHGHRNLEFEKGIKPKIVNLQLKKPTEVDFSLFWNAYDVIDKKSLVQIDNQKGVYGAISGLVQSLQDPFSAFLDPASAKIFTQDLKGQFGGIGAELAQKEGKLVVVSPIDGSPADKAGLKPQDEITKIDNQEVSTLSFGESIVKIRGEKGTKVTLTILRAGLTPFSVTIVRDDIKIESVSFRQEGDFGILRISQFGEDSLPSIKRLEKEIKATKGLVIDLRNNPGGLLQAAIDIASLFDDHSPILLEEGRGGQRQPYQPTQSAIFKDLKLVVLINEGSASASEIFAGYLQDNGKSKLVGVKSFGKGSVQNLEELKDGSMVKITVANWFTPSGRKINAEGINPDVEVKHNPSSDDQMAKALELLAQ